MIDREMSTTTTTDERGRIVIPAAFREKHGDRYRIVALRDRIELIPLVEDPVQGLQEAVGNAFNGTSVEEIRHTAREETEKASLDGLIGTDR